MASGTELFNAWKAGLANKDSSRLAEFFTEDFRFVSRLRNDTKQETLDWVAAGDNSMDIDNLEVIYENDEVAVVQHSANNNGLAMAVYTKKDGKFSQGRIIRTAVSNVATRSTTWQQMALGWCWF